MTEAKRPSGLLAGAARHAREWGGEEGGRRGPRGAAAPPLRPPPAPLPAAPRAETEAPRFCRTVTPSSGSERATPASSQAIRAARPCRPLFHPRPACLRAGETSQRPEPWGDKPHDGPRPGRPSAPAKRPADLARHRAQKAGWPTAQPGALPGASAPVCRCAGVRVCARTRV